MIFIFLGTNKKQHIFDQSANLKRLKVNYESAWCSHENGGVVTNISAIVEQCNEKTVSCVATR